VSEPADDGYRPLRVSAVEKLTSDAVAVTFDVPPELAGDYAFRAGQHLTLRRVVDGQDVRRTYSVCASAASGPLRVAVKRMEGGAFSSWAVAEMQAGDVLDVAPPAGRFGPAVKAGRALRYGLIAAGSGITPVLSIAATVLEIEAGSEVVLLYGNRTTRDVMFLDELADLKDRYPGRLQVLHVLSREEQESPLLSGRLDGERLAQLLTAFVPLEDIDAWYCCGPFGVVTAARDTLLGLGVAPGEVHVELFHAEAPPPRPPRAEGAGEDRASVTAVLHGRASELSVDRDEVLLDAMLAVRSDAPYACRGGVCGTCRARVTSGEVEMAVNWALEPDELAAGVVLTCQSRPVTDRVAIEFV